MNYSIRSVPPHGVDAVVNPLSLRAYYSTFPHPMA
jgi:hypothetical protein